MNVKADKKVSLKRHGIDFWIFLATFVLVLFGIVMVYSASFYYSQQQSGDGMEFFRKQLIGAGLGLVLMLLLMNVNYKIYKNKIFVYGAIIIGIVLLLAVFVPGIGQKINGASRWIKVPLVGGFQPSEIAKFTLVIFLAYWMDKNRWWTQAFVKGTLPVLLVIGLYCGLIVIEPNLSVTICTLLIGMTMLWMGGASWKLIASLFGIGGTVAGGLIATKEYQFERYLAFMDPWKFERTHAYQLIQSLYAMGAGGLFGVGLGKSRQKLLYLPYGESDFILSIIGEELGLIGVLLLLAVFAFLIIRGIRVALTVQDRFGMLLSGGIISVIAIQTCINVAVVTGSIPPTGLPLPFISSGSTSLVVFMSAVGVLLNISRHTGKQ